MPPTESLSYSALRDPIQNVMVQRYRDIAVVMTRFAKSIGVDRKMDTRGHLLEVSYILKKIPQDGVLVAYYRFKDIQNKGRIRVDPIGRGSITRETEPIPADPASDPTYINRNVFSAGSFCSIQDEDIDKWKGNTARVTAFFKAPRGVLTMESGSRVFPLNARGEGEQGAKVEWDLNEADQDLSFLVQYASDGLYSVGEKM